VTNSQRGTNIPATTIMGRRRFLAGAAAAAATAALGPRTVFAEPARGRIDPSGQFGALLNVDEFKRAPQIINPALLARFASQAALREAVNAGPPRRHVLGGLPPVMMQGTNASLGYPGSCEADSFGYGLGTYTASRNAAGFNPSGGPGNQISAAWLFAWAQHRENATGCKGSAALPYLGLLIARGAPSAAHAPYKPDCDYIHGLNVNIGAFSGVGKFAIGSYKALWNLQNAQSTYLKTFKQFIHAGHAIAFSGLVAKEYGDPASAMVKGAFMPKGFIPKSGHGQLIVGYDDSLGHGGAFLVQNSFGTAWPYLKTSAPLLQGRLWWSYESFFASQSLGAIAYSIPRVPESRTVVSLAPINSTSNGDRPPVRIVEAHRHDDKGESSVALELEFAQPIQLDTVRVTPPGGTSPIEGGYNAPIKYGFAQVPGHRPYRAGRYALELDGHTLAADLTEHEPLKYRGYVLIR
jgi:hypothetical protein